MNLHELLQKVEETNRGSPGLDREFEKAFGSVQANVTNSFDGVINLIERELPLWWWSCGYLKLSDLSTRSEPAPNGSSAGIRAVIGVDGRRGPEAMRLLEHPEMGEMFDEGFHCRQRTGTVPLALLVVFLKAKIALAQFDADASNKRMDEGASRPVALCLSARPLCFLHQGELPKNDPDNRKTVDLNKLRK